MLQARAKRCERVQVSDHYQYRYLSITALPNELLQPFYHLNTGRSCRVIRCASKSRDHKGVNLNNGLSFYRFPRVKTHQGSVHLLTARTEEKGLSRCQEDNQHHLWAHSFIDARLYMKSSKSISMKSIGCLKRTVNWKRTCSQRIYPGLSGGRWRKGYVLHRPVSKLNMVLSVHMNHKAY